jgi:hypothetical protein
MHGNNNSKIMLHAYCDVQCRKWLNDHATSNSKTRPYKSIYIDKHERKFKKLKGAKCSVSHADALKKWIFCCRYPESVTQILNSIFCWFGCFTMICCTAEYN